MMKPFWLLIFVGVAFFSCQTKSNQETNHTQNPQEVALDSIAFFTEKIREDAKNPTWYAKRGAVHYRFGRANQAIKDLELAISLDSMDVQYFLDLAEYNLSIGKSEKTKEALENCLTIDPNHTEALLKLGELHLVVRQYKESMEYLVQAIRIDKELAKAYYLKSIIYEETGDTSLAITNLQIAANKNSKMYPAYMKLGTLYAAKRDSLALDYFRIALLLNEESIEAYYNMAMFYQENGYFEKALQQYDSLLANADSEFYDAHYNKGFIFLEFLEDYPKAIEAFSNVIEMKNNYYQAYHNRGLAYELQGNLEQAKADYLQALNILPNYNLSLEGINRVEQKLKKRMQ